MGLLETLVHHYFCTAFVLPNAANDHQRLGPKQSGDFRALKSLGKLFKNYLVILLHFFNHFQELMKGKKWNNTIFFYFPWGRDCCQRKSYKTLFFGLGVVKEWHFLSFYFLFGGIFSFFSFDDDTAFIICKSWSPLFTPKFRPHSRVYCV